MKVIADKIKVFSEDKKAKDKTIRVFTTSISSKAQEDGKFINKSMEVSFAKDALTAEQIAKLVPGYAYDVEVRDGFLTTRKYTTSNGENKTVFVLKLTNVKVLGRQEIKKTEAPKGEGLPF